MPARGDDPATQPNAGIRGISPGMDDPEGLSVVVQIKAGDRGFPVLAVEAVGAVFDRITVELGGLRRGKNCWNDGIDAKRPVGGAIFGGLHLCEESAGEYDGSFRQQAAAGLHVSLSWSISCGRERTESLLRFPIWGFELCDSQSCRSSPRQRVAGTRVEPGKACG